MKFKQPNRSFPARPFVYTNYLPFTKPGQWRMVEQKIIDATDMSYVKQITQDPSKKRKAQAVPPQMNLKYLKNLQNQPPGARDIHARSNYKIQRTYGYGQDFMIPRVFNGHEQFVRGTLGTHAQQSQKDQNLANALNSGVPVPRNAFIETTQGQKLSFFMEPDRVRSKPLVSAVANAVTPSNQIKRDLQLTALSETAQQRTPSELSTAYGRGEMIRSGKVNSGGGGTAGGTGGSSHGNRRITILGGYQGNLLSSSLATAQEQHQTLSVRARNAINRRLSMRTPTKAPTGAPTRAPTELTLTPPPREDLAHQTLQDQGLL